MFSSEKERKASEKVKASRGKAIKYARFPIHLHQPI